MVPDYTVPDNMVPGYDINPNSQWAAILVDQLARCGLQAVCIAPGSRSTPLTLAFHQHPAIEVYLHLDERSASFFALGLAQATGAGATRPVALVCTSGTAAAEFHPAIVEAHQSQIPLLVLTADRPPEMRHSGANQTIDQVKMYGDHVLWFVDAPLPQAAAPPVVLRNLRTLASRAYATADGLRKGAVHINLPFRKPLEPGVPPAQAQVSPGRDVLAHYQQQAAQLPPLARMEQGVLSPSPAQIAALANLIDGSERGMIVCGPSCPAGDFPATVQALARKAGYPLFADPLSGVRFAVQEFTSENAGTTPADREGQRCDPVVSTYETFLASRYPSQENQSSAPSRQSERAPDSVASSAIWPPPELVIRFGAVPTSKWLNDFLDRTAPAHVIHIHQNGVWADDSHRLTQVVQADPTVVCRRLYAEVTDRGLGGSWSQAVLEMDRRTRSIQQEALATRFIDASVIPPMLEMLPAGANLMLGNSLPVRHIDQFGARQITGSGGHLHVYGNRGASGIDGVISTALGIAATGAPGARSRPTVLLIGDVSFYHDMNGLLAIRQHGLNNITIVLLNNDGGGIFRRLPVATFEPPFTSLFLTPHGLDFEHAAKLYGLAHARTNDADSFKELFGRHVTKPEPALIEVCTDSASDEAGRKEIVGLVADALAKT